MTMATKTRRTTRKPQAEPAQPVPVCNVCFKRLGWRDDRYGKEHMCKVCHQKSERKRLHGVYVPRERMPHPTMAYGTERTTKLTARSAVRVAQKAAARANATPKPLAKPPKWERAQRRAEKYIRRHPKKERVA